MRDVHVDITGWGYLRSAKFVHDHFLALVRERNAKIETLLATYGCVFLPADGGDPQPMFSEPAPGAGWVYGPLVYGPHR